MNAFLARSKTTILNIICTQLYIYTQTKKIRPIFMVLYLLIQLRCLNKIYAKMFIKRPTYKSWYSFDFIFLSGRVIEPRVNNSSFHYHQQVDHQNATHFTLNGNQERPTMKKHLNIPKVLIKRAALQFKIVNLRS